MQMDVLVMGPTFVDLVMNPLIAWPELGQEVHVESLAMDVGGSAIVATALARLGMKVGLVTILPDSPLTSWLRVRLQAEGVDVSLALTPDEIMPNVSVAFIRDGDRAFISYRERRLDSRFWRHAVEVLGMVDTKHVHSSTQWAARDVLTCAKQGGATVSLDLGWNPEWFRDPRLVEVVSLADVFIPSWSEAREITSQATPDAAIGVMGQWGPDIIVKCGRNGAVGKAYGRECWAVPAVPVGKEVDSVGAGDNFNAGVISGLLTGHDLKDSAIIGTFCGSRSVGGAGGTSGSPSREVVNRFLSARGIQRL